MTKEGQDQIKEGKQGRRKEGRLSVAEEHKKTPDWTTLSHRLSKRVTNTSRRNEEWIEGAT